MSSPTSSGRAARVYPSLVRTIHVAGVERTAAGLLVLTTLMLLFAFRFNWISAAAAAAVVLVIFPAIRRATSRDPQILAVYRSHLVRSAIYEGQPSPWHPHRNRPSTF